MEGWTGHLLGHDWTPLGFRHSAVKRIISQGTRCDSTTWKRIWAEPRGRTAGRASQEAQGGTGRWPVGLSLL